MIPLFCFQSIPAGVSPSEKIRAQILSYQIRTSVSISLNTKRMNKERNSARLALQVIVKAEAGAPKRKAVVISPVLVTQISQVSLEGKDLT